MQLKILLHGNFVFSKVISSRIVKFITIDYIVNVFFFQFTEVRGIRVPYSLHFSNIKRATSEFMLLILQILVEQFPSISTVFSGGP